MIDKVSRDGRLWLIGGAAAGIQWTVVLTYIGPHWMPAALAALSLPLAGYYLTAWGWDTWSAHRNRKRSLDTSMGYD